MNSHLNVVNCTLATIPKEYLSGVNEPDFQFLGLDNIILTLKNFATDSEHVKNSLSTNFQNILESKINEDSFDLVKSVQNFASFNKGNSILIIRKKISGS